MSFCSLATFYRRFARDFNSTVTLIIDCLKKCKFKKAKSASKTYEEIKDKLITASALRK